MGHRINQQAMPAHLQESILLLTDLVPFVSSEPNISPLFLEAESHTTAAQTLRCILKGLNSHVDRWACLQAACSKEGK